LNVYIFELIYGQIYASESVYGELPDKRDVFSLEVSAFYELYQVGD